MVALIGAGCSSAPADTDSASTGGDESADTRGQGVQFAECMRDNGVREFPDPDASGQWSIEDLANGSAVDTDSVAFEQALTACKDLEPPGFTGDKRTPEQQEAGLGFAQCIRDHGVPDFPDPEPDGPLIDTNRIPSTDQLGGMTALHAAMQGCDASAAGVTGGQ